MNHIEYKRKIHRLIQPDPIGLTSMELNSWLKTISACVSAQPVKHFLLKIGSDHQTLFADNPGHCKREETRTAADIEDSLSRLNQFRQNLVRVLE